MGETEAASGLVQIGETLRAAREGRGLSLDQAAAQLRCDTRLIEALESGRFEDVGPPVFARGHLLRYAALLGEPGEAMVEHWSQIVAGTGAESELMRGLHGPRGRDLRQLRRRLVAAAAMLCVVVTVFWALQNPPEKPSSPDAPALAANARPATTGAAAASGVEASGAAPSGAAAPGPAPGGPAALADPAAAAAAPTRLAAATPAAAAPADLPADAAPPPRGVARLTIALSADSWVEIYDARNRRLFFGLARPDAPVDVRGPAPMRVIVGNAPAATLELNGRRVEVPRDAMRGPRAAALRVTADGRLTALPRA